MNCKTIGCSNPTIDMEDHCPGCTAKLLNYVQPAPKLALSTPTEQAGTDNQNVKKPIRSAEFLTLANEIQSDRGVQYDQLDGERSMGKIVDMFNTLTGHELTETEGWKFMQVLKLVRSQGNYHEDSYVDCVSYAALAAESHAREHESTMDIHETPGAHIH